MLLSNEDAESCVVYWVVNLIGYSDNRPDRDRQKLIVLINLNTSMTPFPGIF